MTEKRKAARHGRRLLRRRSRLLSASRGILLAAITVLVAAAGFLLLRYALQTRRTLATQQQLQRQYRSGDTQPTSGADTAAAIAARQLVTSALPAWRPVSAATQVALAANATPPSAPTPAPQPAMNPHFVSLYAKNSDLAGWLEYNGISGIDFPVVLRDDMFYLTHDFYGREDIAGTVFMDVGNRLWPRDDNIILHGHNMKNGTMFGKLARLLQLSFLQQHAGARFDTLYEEGWYVPYAVSLVSTDAAQARYVAFSVANFATAGEKQAYVDCLRARSAFILPVAVEAADPLLTLVTCHGDEKNERLVIALRKLRQDESPAGMTQLFRQQARPNPSF